MAAALTVLFDNAPLIITRALSEAVTVTAGPPVVRSVNDVEVVVSVAVTVELPALRSARLFTPAAAMYDPAVVAFATAVSKRLSRTEAFHCAAVSAAFATAVRGVVHATSGSDLQAVRRGWQG